MDWKAPTCPKNSCQQGLLDIAIDHLPRLTFEEKFAHGLPNTHLSQTINKVSCNNVEDLLATAEKELDKIQELAYLKENEETRFGGSVRLEPSIIDTALMMALRLSVWPLISGQEL